MYYLPNFLSLSWKLDKPHYNNFPPLEKVLKIVFGIILGRLGQREIFFEIKPPLALSVAILSNFSFNLKRMQIGHLSENVLVWPWTQSWTILSPSNKIGASSLLFSSGYTLTSLSEKLTFFWKINWYIWFKYTLNFDFIQKSNENFCPRLLKWIKIEKIKELYYVLYPLIIIR